MTKRTLAVLGTVLGAGLLSAVVLDAHDLFLRPRDYVVREGAPVSVRVLNGTFTTSASLVAPKRLRDLTVQGPDGATHPDQAGWTGTGTESAWALTLGRPGTYVLGASLIPNTIRLTGTQFNGYLREEGLPEVLAARRESGELDRPAHERYAKHVKALVRVNGSSAPPAAGDTAFRAVLGYPAELVPLDNPYRLQPGGTLRVRALVDGKPVMQQVVLTGGQAGGRPIKERQLRTDAEGIVRVALSQRGVWYVKFISMTAVPTSASDSVTHESKWATLTFALP